MKCDRRRTRWRGSVGLLLLAAAAGGVLGGCGIAVPTAAPILQQQWQVPVAESTLGVDDLLAGDAVSLKSPDAGSTSDPGASALTSGRGLLSASTNASTHSSASGSCTSTNEDPVVSSGDGTITVDVESIQCRWTIEDLADSTATVIWDLPDEVESVEVQSVTFSSGTVVASLESGLDGPLRAGELKVTARSTEDDTELLTFALEEELAPGGSISQSWDFGEESITVSGGIALRFEATPSGDPSGTLTATVSLQSLTAVSARVLLKNQDVKGEGTAGDFDVAGFSEITETVEEATVIVTVDNPFPITVDGRITLGERTKSITIKPEATSKTEIHYSGEQLQSLLNEGIAYKFSGTASSDGEVTLDPTKVMTITITVDVSSRIEI